jgi:hypothetical protein
MAGRHRRALTRLEDAAEKLADRFRLADHAKAIRTAAHKDHALATMLKHEAIAVFLEAMLAKVESPASLPAAADRVSGMTVAELTTRIETATADDLDAYEAEELAGKARKGVLAAIHQRRADLAAEEPPDADD